MEAMWMHFERNDFQEIRERAEGLAKDDKSLAESWRRALLALADAADRLDAMTARCTVPEKD
jgi:hypothetical protein